MHLENAPREAGIAAQGGIDLDDAGKDMESLQRRRARRRGRAPGDRTDRGISLRMGKYHRPRGNPENGSAARTDQRTNLMLGCSTASLSHGGQADRHVDGDRPLRARIGDEAAKIGKNRRFGAVALAGPMENGNPAAAAAVDAREPSRIAFRFC